jgi:phosphatidylinositol glycan class A protein
MREKHILQNRVCILGAVSNSKVCSILNKGQIFLNASLTEAFGIAILEAACAGLHVVCTRVGGVPELLPDEMITFAEPTAAHLIHALSKAIENIHELTPENMWQRHHRVASMYSWKNVADRTLLVYKRASQCRKLSLAERFVRYRTGGPIAGIIFCCIAAIDVLVLAFLDYWFPRELIDPAPTYYSRRRETPRSSAKDFDDVP